MSIHIRTLNYLAPVNHNWALSCTCWGQFSIGQQFWPTDSQPDPLVSKASQNTGACDSKAPIPKAVNVLGFVISDGWMLGIKNWLWWKWQRHIQPTTTRAKRNTIHTHGSGPMNLIYFEWICLDIKSYMCCYRKVLYHSNSLFWQYKM